jgi:hypothetical protein
MPAVNLDFVCGQCGTALATPLPGRCPGCGMVVRLDIFSGHGAHTMAIEAESEPGDDGPLRVKAYACPECKTAVIDPSWRTCLNCGCDFAKWADQLAGALGQETTHSVTIELPSGVDAATRAMADRAAHAMEDACPQCGGWAWDLGGAVRMHRRSPLLARLFSKRSATPGEAFTVRCKQCGYVVPVNEDPTGA